MDSEKFQTAEGIFRVTQCHRYWCHSWHSTGSIWIHITQPL